MPKFEDAVIRALGTLPAGYWQRIDGLMCEHEILNMRHPFGRLRLWLLEKRGLVESVRWGRGSLRSYRLRPSSASRT